MTALVLAVVGQGLPPVKEPSASAEDPAGTPPRSSAAAAAVSDGPPLPRHPRDATVPLAERLSRDPETRALELMDVLRSYRPFRRDEEMAEAIRELGRLGKPVVPLLIAELERTDEELTLRVLAIALRGTNDPRAIPALIRAISRSVRPRYGYCRVFLLDPDLRRFASTLEDHPELALPTMRVDLAVNELLATLERLAGLHLPGGEADIGGQPDLQQHGLERWQQLLPDLQSQAFFRRQETWQTWWQANHGGILSEAEFREFNTPPRIEPPVVGQVPQPVDRVQQAGEARFGPMFPTGPAARLGPVVEVDLFDTMYADVPSAIDFDTQRVGRVLEREAPTPDGYRAWTLRRGVDAVVGANWEDAAAWHVEDRRWETIDAEIKQARPLPLGQELPDSLLALPDGATVLFATREGGSGILQLAAPDRASGARRLRYRMWVTPFSAGGLPRPETEASRGIADTPIAAQWGEAVDVTLQAPGEEAGCGWSLSRKEYVSLPRHILSRELSDQFWLKGEEVALNVWKQKEGISFLTKRAAPIDRQRSLEVDLFLLGSVVRRVHPSAFAAMSAATAGELLQEPAAGEPQWAVQFVRETERPQPQTYLFRTAGVEMGLMQMRGSSLTGGLPTFRYKLVEK